MNINYNYEYITDQKGLEKVAEWCESKPYVGFDIETGPAPKYYDEFQRNNKLGLDPYRAKIYTIQIGDNSQQFIIDMRGEYSDLSVLFDVLEDNDTALIGVNLRFDVKMVMHHFNIRPTKLVDAMIMEQLIRCGVFPIGSSERSSMAVRRYTSMASLAKRYLNLELDKDKDLRIGLWKTQIGEYDSRQLEYMAGDVIFPELIVKKQKKLIMERDLSGVVQLENELIPVVANMELVGIPFDRNMWVERLQDAKVKMIESERVLDEIFGAQNAQQEDLFGNPVIKRRFDYSSSSQMSQALNSIGVKGFVSTTGNTLSSSSDKIKLMKVNGKIDPELADTIMNYRIYKKKIESYGENFLKAVNPVTKRIHCDFTQACLVTGRMSCSPGMQTIPADSDYRAPFDSPEGYTLIILDASQIEARISADLTNDHSAVETFKKGEDIYKNDGEIMYNREIDKSTPEGKKLRNRAKVSWLGLTYGQGKNKFNRYCKLFLGEDISQEETDFLWDKFFEIHWKMKEVMDEWSDSVDPQRSNQYFYDEVAESTIDEEKAYDSLLEIYLDRFNNDRDKAEKLVNYLLSRKQHVCYTSTRLGRKRFYRSDYVGWWTAARNAPIQGCAADIQKATMLAFQTHHWENGYDAHIINVVHDEIVTLVRKDQAEKLYQEQIELGNKVGQKFLDSVPMKIDGVISKFWCKPD